MARLLPADLLDMRQLPFLPVGILPTTTERRLSQIQYIEAKSLAASLGVNVHLNFSGTAYQNVTAVQTALDYMGINTMRDMGAQTNTSPYATLADKGFHFDFFAPGAQYQLDINTLISRLHNFAAAHPGAITSLEGPNEVNNWPITYNGRVPDLLAAGKRATSRRSSMLRARIYFRSLNSALRNDSICRLSAGEGGHLHPPDVDMVGRRPILGPTSPPLHVPMGNQPPRAAVHPRGLMRRRWTPGLKMAIAEKRPSDPGVASSGPGRGLRPTHAKLTHNTWSMDCPPRRGSPRTFLNELVDENNQLLRGAARGTTAAYYHNGLDAETRRHGPCNNQMDHPDPPSQGAIPMTNGAQLIRFSGAFSTA
jgi:hypothetical protein